MIHLALPTRPTLFPYTTLFRSISTRVQRGNRGDGRGFGKRRDAGGRGGWPFAGGVRGHARRLRVSPAATAGAGDRKSTRLNSSHITISYAVFCLKKKKIKILTM